MALERAAPAFAVGFAAFYVPAFEFNWAAFTYFPALNAWHWGVVAMDENSGPPMYWFGWMFYAALVGIGLGLLSLLLPARQTEKAWAVLAWAAPLAAIVTLGYLSRHWFL